MKSIGKNQWRLIENAPKDGTEILAHDAESAGPVLGACCYVVWWVSDQLGWVVCTPEGREPQYFNEATHWIPLPESPAKCNPHA